MHMPRIQSLDPNTETRPSTSVWQPRSLTDPRIRIPRRSFFCVMAVIIVAVWQGSAMGQNQNDSTVESNGQSIVVRRYGSLDQNCQNNKPPVVEITSQPTH